MEKNPFFMYSHDVTNENIIYGFNDIFEIYTSHKDSMPYLVSPNGWNHNLDIFELIDNHKIVSIKGHNNYILTIRYFINNRNYREYLISADDDKLVIVWDLNNNYEIKYKIETNYGLKNYIFTCLLIFPHYDKNNYIITSSCNGSNNMEESAPKVYSLNDGKFIRYFDKRNIDIVYLLSWSNKKKEKDYVIEFSNKIIIKNLIEEETYVELDPGNYIYGFIYNKYNNEYLYSSLENGLIIIFDLYNKNKVEKIETKYANFHSILNWNDNYIITADYKNKLLFIIDSNIKKIISKIEGNNIGKIKAIKKFFHPKYGESLLIGQNTGIISLWILK